MRQKGFTLIELMIVVAIIAIIAAVAIPGLLRSRIGSNEASAQGSLKSIVTGEEQFKSANCIDINANGVGEYGFLEELAGVTSCRSGTVPGAIAQSGPVYAASPYIPRILGTVNPNMEASKAGYFISLWLPVTNTTATNDATPTGDAVTAALSEAAYVAYAWPQAAGRSGVRTFVIDPQGQPYSMANNTPTFTATGAITDTAGAAGFNCAFTFNGGTGNWGTWYIHDGGPGLSAAENWVPTG